MKSRNLSTRLKVAALTVLLTMGVISFNSCGRDTGIDPNPVTVDTTYHRDLTDLAQIITIRDNVKQGPNKQFFVSLLNNTRLGMRTAELSRLSALLELIGSGNVRFMANGAVIVPLESIQLDDATAKVLVDLWNKGVRFTRGDGKNAFYITSNMGNLFTPEMLQELMYSDAQTLDIKTADDIDAVVAQALELAKAGNRVVVNFEGRDGKLSIPAEKLSAFRPIAGANIAANVSFIQTQGLIVTVEVGKDQISAYHLNTRALMNISQPWTLNPGKSATAVGGVNNIVGYDDNCIGLDTVLYQTKFPGIDQPAGTYVYEANTTPMLGGWFDRHLEGWQVPDIGSIPPEKRAKIPKLQIGPGGDNSYAKMCAMYNRANDGTDNPYNFRHMGMGNIVNIEILPDDASTSYYSNYTGYIGAPFSAINLTGAHFLFGHENIGVPYMRRVVFDDGSIIPAPSFPGKMGKINLILPGHTAFCFKPGVGESMWYIQGQDGPALIKSLYDTFEAHGITIITTNKAEVFPIGFLDSWPGVPNWTNRNTVKLDLSDWAVTRGGR